MNVLLIDGVAYRIGAKAKRVIDGKIGVITKFLVSDNDDPQPLKVDFMDGECRYCGPNSEVDYYRITLVESKKEGSDEQRTD